MQENVLFTLTPHLRQWAMWVQGQWVGVLVATYICIAYHHTNVVARMFNMWAICFSGLMWHLASSWLNWLLHWQTTKWPSVIPLLVWKSSSDFWLVNSTCKPKSQARRVLPQRKLPCGNPWQSYSAGRGKKKWGGREERAGWGAWQSFYLQLHRIRMIILWVHGKSNPNNNVTAH